MTEEKPKEIKEKMKPIAEEKISAEKESITEEIKENPVEKIEIKEVDVPKGISTAKKFDIEAWKPRTELGKLVKAGKIKTMDELLNRGERILEPEITEALIPNLEHDLFSIGQSKGKFGGGKRNIWRQTQKKTKEGNKPHFGTMVVIGNRDGYIGIGYGKAKETVPAREKAIRNAKLNIIKIRRACGSWECGCAEPHSIPFKVQGRCGSVKVQLIPAPKGTRLCVQKDCAKLLEFAGVKDVYSKTFGQTRVKVNLVKACFSAMKLLSRFKIQPEYYKKAGVLE